MEQNTGTMGAELDRLEVKAGKIGMNSREQAYALLHGLDDVYLGMESISNEQSRKVVEAQFNGIVAKMQGESRLMLRDLGGRAALVRERDKEQPPKEHVWWYLDEHLAGTRQNSLRRLLVTGGILLAVLAVLAVLYQAFLAPDPGVAERYGLEQNARDLMMTGDLQASMEQIEKGLALAPRDPTLTTLKGVVQDLMGQAEGAQATFETASGLFERPEDFYVTRGQAYSMANQAEKALADALEAIRLNPNAPEAYLLAGQAHELLGMVREALADYEKAYTVADAVNELELAAMARMRTAMLMQSMNNMILPGMEPTPTP